MGKSAFQTGLKLHPLVSPTILSANMWDMFHFFLVFTYTKDFYGLYHDALWVMTSFFVLYYSSVAMMKLSIRELLHSSIFWAGPFYYVCSRGCSSLAFLLDLNLGPGSLLVVLKTDRKNPVPTHPIFYFVPSVSVFVGSCFRIYRNRRGVFPSISPESRFHPELTRIYSVFHPVFNLCEICLEIDMFINLLITNYAC